jgi:hypothetical protein
MTKWDIKPSLEDEAADAFDWARRFVAGRDAKLKSVYATWHPRNSYNGYCRYPKGAGYATIRLRVPEYYPKTIQLRLRPLYRNPDGSWPPLPPGARRGEAVSAYTNLRTGKRELYFVPSRVIHFAKPEDYRLEREWYRLLGGIQVQSASEAVVWIFAHEAYHYLTKFKLITGRNAEIEADAFANAELEKWRQR